MEMIFVLTLLVILTGCGIKLYKKLNNLFAFYGGILGTIIAFVINTFQWCFLAWLAGFIIPGVNAGLGIFLGPIYCAYCWICNKENKFLSIIFGIK